MKTIEKYDRIKNQLLSDDVQQHFNNLKEYMEKYTKALDSYELDFDKIDDNGAQMYHMINNNFHYTFTFITKVIHDLEAIYVANMILKEKISDLESMLDKQGMKIENISNNEGLEWLNNYFKHAGGTSFD